MAVKNRKVQTVVVWEAHPGPQTEFLNSKEFEVFYGGSRGGGKTAALIAFMLVYASNPDYAGLLLRRTFPQLLQVRLRAKKLYTKIDPDCKYNKDDNVFELSSGATIQLGHVQHDDDVERYQGFEYQVIGFEELTQFKEQHYEAIKLSCRAGTSGMIPMVRATGNPRGIGHAFVKKRFINIGPPGTVATETLPDGNVLTRKFVKARVFDNPTLLKNDPQYVAVLMGIKDPKLRAAMLEGDWDAAEGMFFSEFDRDALVKPMIDVFPSGKPDDGMPIYASLDWGYSKPFAIYWHAINRYDKVITFKEWYGIKTDPLKNEYMDNVGIQMLDEDVAREFLRRSEGMNIEYLVADPSIKIRTGAAKQGAPSSILRTFQEILGNAGIPVVLGNNDRKAGWMQVKSRMKDAPDGNPWWVITDNCRHLIRTMPDLPEDMNDPDDLDSDAEDHSVDSIRYFMQQIPMDTSRSPSRLYHQDTNIETFRNMPRGLEQQLGGLAATYH